MYFFYNFYNYSRVFHDSVYRVITFEIYKWKIVGKISKEIWKLEIKIKKYLNG